VWASLKHAREQLEVACRGDGAVEKKKQRGRMTNATVYGVEDSMKELG
jgi:hypothetical protein